MQTIHDISSIRQFVHQQKIDGKRIGLVTTMGFLHAGHLSLVAKAKATCDIVITSIFVNPLQFGPTEDLDKYPSNLERDAQLLSEAGCDALFTPTVKEMYPTPPLLTVTVADLDAGLCGRSRPGHFAGVATVVTKLFNIVQPDMAFFGQKDGQQITVIRRLVMDLNLPIEIVAVPTVREASGLALSSRNVYLTPEDREHATVLSRALREAEATLQAGKMEAEAILADIQSRIANESGVRLDYAEIVDAQTLHPIEGKILRDVMIAVAAYVGKARLIDNVVVSVGAKTQEERA